MIESMLLLRESQKRSENPEIPAFNLRLNNQYMHLGTDRDVLCDFSDNSAIGIQLYDTSDKERMFNGAWSAIVNEKSEPSSILQPIHMPQREGDVEIFLRSALFAKIVLNILTSLLFPQIGWDPAAALKCRMKV